MTLGHAAREPGLSRTAGGVLSSWGALYSKSQGLFLRSELELSMLI